MRRRMGLEILQLKLPFPLFSLDLLGEIEIPYGM